MLPHPQPLPSTQTERFFPSKHRIRVCPCPIVNSSCTTFPLDIFQPGVNHRQTSTRACNKRRRQTRTQDPLERHTPDRGIPSRNTRPFFTSRCYSCLLNPSKPGIKRGSTKRRAARWRAQTSSSCDNSEDFKESTDKRGGKLKSTTRTFTSKRTSGT